jgi:serine/threonine protein phosphatase PrpC
MTVADTSTESDADTAGKAIVAVVVAAVVAVVAAVSGVGIVVTVLAAIAALGAFFVLDGFVSSPEIVATTTTQNRPTPDLPSTSSVAIPPVRGVDAPTITEPASAEAVASIDEQVSARLDPSLLVADSVEVRAAEQSSSRAFAVRIAKHGTAIAECEDALAIDPRRSVMAVADGASSSFGAGGWARALAEQFVRRPPRPLSPASFAAWLTTTRSGADRPADAADADTDSSGWWSEKGAREGAYSTLVGVAIVDGNEGRVATVMCVGDSCAFVLGGAPGSRTLRRSIPYEDAGQFGSHPALLGSADGRDHDEPLWTSVPVAAGDVVVLASDAVSEWLMADPTRFEVLDGYEPAAIAERLVAERSDGRIVNDDLTIALMDVPQRATPGGDPV